MKKQSKKYFIGSGISAVLSIICLLLTGFTNSIAYWGTPVLQRIQSVTGIMFFILLAVAVILLIVGFVCRKKHYNR